MASAFTRYSSDYISQERAAIGARLGVHAHDGMKAWDWRAQRRKLTENCRGKSDLRVWLRARAYWRRAAAREIGGATTTLRPGDC